MPKRARSVEGESSKPPTNDDKKPEEDGVNTEDSDHINDNDEVTSRRRVCEECDNCQRPKTEACLQQRCMSMSEQKNESYHDNVTENEESATSSSSPQKSKEDKSTKRRSSRPDVPNIKGTSNSEKPEGRLLLQEPQKKARHRINKDKQTSPETSSDKKVMIFWNDGVINIVHADDLYSCHHGRRSMSKAKRSKPKLDVGEEVKMIFNKKWYRGTILSVDETEFTKVASKYPSKHFVLREPDMVVYSKLSSESSASDEILSEDEDFQMVFGEDDAQPDLDNPDPSHSRSCEKDLNTIELSEYDADLGIISEFIEVQTIKLEEFNAMGDEVGDPSENDPNASPSKYKSLSDITCNSVPEEQNNLVHNINDLIKPCSVVIETNIANEMTVTDIYLVDQKVVVKMTENISIVSEPPVVNSPSPVKLQNQSCGAEYTLAPEISKYLSSCKDVQLIPTNAKNKSQLNTAESSSDQGDNKNKRKLPKHSFKNLKGFIEATANESKTTHVIHDKFSKLVASKLSLKGVDIIPIKTVDKVKDEQGGSCNDNHFNGQTVHQPIILKPPDVLSPESIEKVCAVERSMKTVTTSQSSSIININSNEMVHVTNQISKITNSFDSNTKTFTMTQQLMENSVMTSLVYDSSFPKVITLPVLSCENYFSTTGVVGNSCVSGSPFLISNVVSQNLDETKANEFVGFEKSSLLQYQKDRNTTEAADKGGGTKFAWLKMLDDKVSSKTSPKEQSPTNNPFLTKPNELNSENYRKLQTSVVSSHVIQQTPAASSPMLNLRVTEPNVSKDCKKLVTPVPSSLVIQQTLPASSPTLNLSPVKPNGLNSKDCKKLQKLTATPLVNQQSSAVSSAILNACPTKPNELHSEDLKKLQIPASSSNASQQTPPASSSTLNLSSVKSNALNSKDCKKLQNPTPLSHSNQKSSAVSSILNARPTKPNELNSEDRKKLQITTAPSIANQKTPPASNKSTLSLCNSSDSDCDTNNHLVTSSIKNCLLLKEPSLEDCLDGVPPFIQDVFLCDNIRDGFINSDLVFVLSLLPDMEEMTDTQKFHFQMKVIETLNDVLDDPKLQIKRLR